MPVQQRLHIDRIGDRDLSIKKINSIAAMRTTRKKGMKIIGATEVVWLLGIHHARTIFRG